MTEKPHILIESPWYEPSMARLDDFCTTHHLYKAEDRAAFLAEVGPKCVAIGTMHDCPASLMDAAPNVRLICNFGVGYDGVDVTAATARGIRVINTPSVLNDCVADLALGLLLAGRRQIVQCDAYARAGRWVAEGDFRYTARVHGSIVGIVGLGRIGLEIAARCAAFKMDIRYHNRRPRSDVDYRYYADPVALARDCEILVVICPGGEATRGLIGEAVLNALGPAGLLVNVARGSVVDTGALVGALRDGRLGAAALDVFPDEPRIPAELLALTDNLTLTPHVASATHFTRNAMGQVIIDNLKAFLAGEPLLTPVN